MTILSVDTSGACASIAVTASGKVMYESSLNMALTHSETLMPMIDAALSYLGIQSDTIDLFATAIGPGSFTGIRIGIAVIQALAHATGKKVIGVNTLDGLAANAPGHSCVCALIDARHCQAYAALYDTSTGIETLVQPMATSIEVLKSIITKEEPILFVGDAALAYKQELMNMFGDEAIIPPAHIMQQRAASIGYAAQLKAERGEMLDPFKLIPLYLKKTQAEMKYGKRGES